MRNPLNSQCPLFDHEVPQNGEELLGPHYTVNSGFVQGQVEQDVTVIMESDKLICLQGWRVSGGLVEG